MSCRHVVLALQWRHNGRDGVSNHQPYHCLVNRLFRRKSKKTSKLRVTGHCAEDSSVTGEFHAQMASNAEKVSIWWRHHVVRWYQFAARPSAHTCWLSTVKSKPNHTEVYTKLYEFIEVCPNGEQVAHRASQYCRYTLDFNTLGAR